MKAAQTIIFLIVLSAASVLAQINSSTIASWTFENNPLTNPVTNSSVGPISPELGQGELRGFHSNSTTVWNSSDSGNGSLRALNANRWASGDYFEFRVQKTDTNDTVEVTWHQRRSQTAPQQFSLRYSTNGTNFSVLTNYSPATNNWSGTLVPTDIYTYQLTNLSTLTNSPLNLTFRIVANTNASNTAGTSRIDNVSFVSLNAKNRYFATIADQRVEIERWGSGPKGVIIFSHTGSIANTFKANSALVQTLVGTNYSVFTWEYPDVAPFSQKWNALGDWMAGWLTPQDRLLFPGVASSLLAQIRQATGLQQFILVGNSMGAGVVLSDYDALAQDALCKMLLISPTEAFLPTSLPAYLQNAFLISDPYNSAERFLRRQEDKDFCARNINLPLPAYNSAPGHIIIDDAQSITYAFSLVGCAFQQQGTVTILSPKSADVVWGNSIAQISWFASFGNGQVRLDLLKAGQIISTIADSVPNNFRYVWAVPESLPDGADYAIRISNVGNPDQVGGAENPFTLSTISISNAVDSPSLSWSTGGNAPWFGQARITSDGIDALQSGKIADSQTNYFETTLDGPGNLTFDWLVSSEENYDFLTFSFPGTIAEISGASNNWASKTFSIPAGNITVRWSYEKDNILAGGEDAGWVDNIKFVPDSIEGIPGAWWVQHFGTTEGVSASSDADGDGFTNAQEYALGTIPTDASSTFRVRSATSQSGTVTISWDAIAGKTYQLVARSSLATGDWQPVGEPLTASASGPVSRNDAPSTPTRFYRVTLAP